MTPFVITTLYRLRVTGYDAVRIAVGTLLLVAAGLKVHQLATQRVLGTALLDSRWLLMATVEFELFFGLWLLANLWPKFTCAATVTCFGAFACVSIYKGFSGYATCGCFGRLPVNPWYTATLDASAVVALLVWRPMPWHNLALRLAFRRTTRVLILWVILGVPAAAAMSMNGAITAETGMTFLDRGVLLEPENWIGRQFPLSNYIDIGRDLQSGSWIVVVHRVDCPECEAFARELDGRFASSSDGSLPGPLAYVAMSSGSSSFRIPLHVAANCRLGRLANRYEWLVSTPLVVVLKSGVVVEVFKGPKAGELLNEYQQSPTS